MLEAIVGAYHGIKTAAEITQSLLELKTDAAVTAKAVELNGVIIDVQGKLLETQTQYSSVIGRVNELEAEIVRFKDWENEKQRYHLQQLVPGTLVYRLKPGMENGEPPHELCPHCYQQRVKSILQGTGTSQGREMFVCPHCKFSFIGKRIPLDDRMPRMSEDDPRRRRMF
jgi:Zn finger protein HypA/HybF involved in hydrogenase expression